MMRFLAVMCLCVALVAAHGVPVACPDDYQVCVDIGGSCFDPSDTNNVDLGCAPGAERSSQLQDCVCLRLPQIGDACSALRPCVVGSYAATCYNETGTATCAWVGIYAPGEACVADDANYINGGCVDGSSCVAGVCSGEQLLVEQGDACNSTSDCVFPLTCLFNGDGSTQCGRPYSQPESYLCNSPDQCVAGLYCNNDPAFSPATCSAIESLEAPCINFCPGGLSPNPPLQCTCNYTEGSTRANYTARSAESGVCKPSLTWVPNTVTRQLDLTVRSCYAVNKCPRGALFGPGSCGAKYCFDEMRAFLMSMNIFPPMTCAEVGNIPFYIGGDPATSASVQLVSALLSVLVVSLALLIL